MRVTYEQGFDTAIATAYAGFMTDDGYVARRYAYEGSIGGTHKRARTEWVDCRAFLPCDEDRDEDDTDPPKSKFCTQCPDPHGGDVCESILERE